MIPKRIHLTWKSRGLLSIDSRFLDKTVKSLVRLSPDWIVEVSDDYDVNEYLKDNLSTTDWKNLEHRSIIEKIDVWRLVKLYNEGGLYVDVDRLCNRSLNDFITNKTKVVLPTCADHDFSHDFMCSEPENPIFYETLRLNLERRANGASNIYFLGPQTYLHGIMVAMFGRIDESFSVSAMRNELTATNFCVTMRETPPYKTILFNGGSTFDHEQEKREFYKENGMKHWTNEW